MWERHGDYGMMSPSLRYKGVNHPLTVTPSLPLSTPCPTNPTDKSGFIFTQHNAHWFHTPFPHTKTSEGAPLCGHFFSSYTLSRWWLLTNSCYIGLTLPHASRIPNLLLAVEFGHSVWPITHLDITIHRLISCWKDEQWIMIRAGTRTSSVWPGTSKAGWHLLPC